jgi:hypothetical protein
MTTVLTFEIVFVNSNLVGINTSGNYKICTSTCSN